MIHAVLDQGNLENIRTHLDRDKDDVRTKSLDRLVREAERWLVESPPQGWSVITKSTIPPSGDRHDYLSFAPYWFPSDTADGLPFVRRDGQLNPASITVDKINKAKVFQSCYILSLAWFYSRNEEYAERAATILRTWFVDTGTAMNPHLQYAQGIPGVNDGRPIGIIDFAGKFSSVLDAASILAHTPSPWTTEDQRKFAAWNEKYLDWLLNSQFGKEESLELNNHGTFATMQKAGIALMLDRLDVVHDELESAKRRVDSMIGTHGAQEHELARTRSWHYSCFNLVAFARIAEIGLKVGVDLWQFRGSLGQSIHDAVNYLIPVATGQSEWQHAETKLLPYLATDLIRASARHGNATAQSVLDQLQPPPLDLWELCLVSENHDAVV